MLPNKLASPALFGATKILARGRCLSLVEHPRSNCSKANIQTRKYKHICKCNIMPSLFSAINCLNLDLLRAASSRIRPPAQAFNCLYISSSFRHMLPCAASNASKRILTGHCLNAAAM